MMILNCNAIFSVISLGFSSFGSSLVVVLVVSVATTDSEVEVVVVVVVFLGLELELDCSSSILSTTSYNPPKKVKNNY